jgi:type I restriction enzyme S subunit
VNSTWITKKLSDVCDNITDGTHQTPKYFDQGHIFLSSRNVKTGIINWDNIKYLDDVQHELMQKRLSPKRGDVLLAKNGTTGVAAIVDRDVSFDIYVSLALLRPLECLVPRFLLHFVNSPIAKAQFNKRLKGIGVPNLHLKEIRDVEIKFPKNLEQQQKIVAKLDQAFADIEKVKENAEQNLVSAKELFDSYLQGIFSHGQEGWAESSLQNITSKIGSGATPRGGKAAYKEHGMSLIRSMNVHDRRFKEKNLALIDDEQAGKLNNVTLEKDDVLLNITGASVARCCVVPDEYLPARVNQHVSIIRVDTDIISPRFMCFLLTSTYYKNILLEVGGSGATREAITKVQLQNFVIKYPDTVEKQEGFLDELTGIESKSLKLQNIYTKKIHALNELKQSILQKAFNGELA